MEWVRDAREVGTAVHCGRDADHRLPSRETHLGLQRRRWPESEEHWRLAQGRAGAPAQLPGLSPPRTPAEDDYFAAGSAGRWASRSLFGSRSATRPSAVRPPRAFHAPVPQAKGRCPLDSHQGLTSPWTPGWLRRPGPPACSLRLGQREPRGTGPGHRPPGANGGPPASLSQVYHIRSLLLSRPSPVGRSRCSRP